MTAGVLSNAGYFMGEDLLPPRSGNPKGFFESARINRINEDLLALVAPTRPRSNLLGRLFYRHIPTDGMRWLSQVPTGTTMPLPDEQTTKRIREFTSRTPYCYKDPRFSYTLPCWREYLEDDTVFICVFRAPTVTARSILKDQERAPVHYGDLEISFHDAVRVWDLMYRHIFSHVEDPNDWLFLHYDQILYGSGLKRISKFTGSKVDRSFPDPNLKRTKAGGDISSAALTTYKQLCELADYRLDLSLV